MNKHHHERYWFKPKPYGFGFIPITWEGWVCTLVVVALIFMSAYSSGIFEGNVSYSSVFRLILDLFLIAGVTLVIFEKRMKEPLKWRWGSWL